MRMLWATLPFTYLVPVLALAVTCGIGYDTCER